MDAEEPERTVIVGEVVWGPLTLIQEIILLSDKVIGALTSSVDWTCSSARWRLRCAAQ